MIKINNMNWPWKPFQQDGKYGYIDRLGYIRVKPIWDDVLNGKLLSPLEYYSHHMLLPVKLGGKWGMVDGDNTLIISPQFDKTSSFFECDDGKQYATVTMKQGSKSLTALINSDGKIVVDPMDDADMILPNGFVIFSRQFGKKILCGIRTISGTVIIPCKFTTIHFCPTNLRKVALNNVDCDKGCWDIYHIQLYSDYPNPEVFHVNTDKGVVISAKVERI